MKTALVGSASKNEADDQVAWKKTYDCADGEITVMLELNTTSGLVRDAMPENTPKSDFRLLVTATANSGLLRFWKLDSSNKLHSYMEIRTSLDSVGWINETTETQLIAASNKNLKVLNFVSKEKKEETEKSAKDKKTKQETMKKLF